MKEKINQEFRADLHCHTTCSDGSMTPEEIVRLAHELDLSGLSITDHDTVDAYEVAVPLAKQLGVELISGAEFSSIQDKDSVHILAYAFPLQNRVLQAFCEKHALRRRERNREILSKLAKHNIPISEEEMLASLTGTLSFKRTLGRPHIALAMYRKGYVSNPQEAFRKYLGEGKLCFCQGESFTAEETINVIHQAKGLAIIAHPHLLNSEGTLKKLLKLPFDGIECYYAHMHANQNERWLQIAKDKNWIVTGGSDFHGELKPQISLGSSWVDQERFSVLQNHFINA